MMRLIGECGLQMVGCKKVSKRLANLDPKAKGPRGGHPIGMTMHPSITHMVTPAPTVIWMRARREPPNRGLTPSRDAPTGPSNSAVPAACPNMRRARGEPPQSGGHTLSKAQSASQNPRAKDKVPQSGTYALSKAQSASRVVDESKRRAPPIGGSCTLKKPSWPLKIQERKVKPPNRELTHSRKPNRPLG